MNYAHPAPAPATSAASAAHGAQVYCTHTAHKDMTLKPRSTLCSLVIPEPRSRAALLAPLGSISTAPAARHVGRCMLGSGPGVLWDRIGQQMATGTLDNDTQTTTPHHLRHPIWRPHTRNAAATNQNPTGALPETRCMFQQQPTRSRGQPTRSPRCCLDSKAAYQQQHPV
jgi:hypothetical protein